MVFGTNHILQSANSFTSISQPYTFSAVANRTSNATTLMLMLGIPAATGQLDFRQVASAVAMFAGTVSQFISNISDVNYHSFQAIFNGASSVLSCGGSAGTSCSVAGVSNSISPGASTASGGVLAIGNATAANALQMTEGAIWAIGFSGTQEANMAANQAGYWGPY